MYKLALIGDIKESRAIQDRKAFQEKLHKILGELNKRKIGIVSPYTITIGDEFQALFDNGDRVLLDVIYLMSLLYPVKVRFALGIGAITTGINKKSAVGMDGPAFHYARSVIENMKKNRSIKGGIIGIDGEISRSCSAPLVKSGLQLFSSVLFKYTPSIIQILIGIYNGNPVSEIAEERGVSAQSVYKSIRKNALIQMAAFVKDYEYLLTGMLKNV